MSFLKFFQILKQTTIVKKIFLYILICIFSLLSLVTTPIILFASPESALNQNSFAEKLLYKLQNNVGIDEEIEKLYRYLDILFHENTQFYSYNIAELENLMDSYRNNIIIKAREIAGEEKYKEAVEFLESKSEIFKDKTTINSLISHYSKFFVADGLFYSQNAPIVLSINKLIAYPTLAFKDNPKSDELDSFYLTSKEFQNLLGQLYSEDYILIDIEDYIEILDGKALKRDLYLPQDKKPLILVFNDANYFENEPYFIDKFIIEGNGNISCFSSKQAEKDQISSLDFIPVLEKFVQENNDFSFKNSRAIISFENSGNVLGYNITKNNPSFNQEANALKRLVGKLKDKNYKFAFGQFSNVFDEQNIEDEIKNIEANMINIFGDATIFFLGNNEMNSNKVMKQLKEIGFKIFIQYGENNISIKNNVAIIKTTLINGKYLRENKKFLGIETEKIYDHNNRSKLF